MNTGITLVGFVLALLTVAHASDLSHASVYRSGITLKSLLSDKPVSMGSFDGQVTLISNVASACGFTEKAYRQMNELHKRYANRGLKILAVPSNTFQQEPGSSNDIFDFAVRQKSAKYTVTAKIDVNGPDTHDLFRWLKGETMDDSCDDRDVQCVGWATAGECEKNPNYMIKNCKKSCTKCSQSYPFAGPISWNFDFFLVGRDGNVLMRWDRNIDLLAQPQLSVIENALTYKTNAAVQHRERAPFYLAAPFVLITILLIVFALRVHKDPVTSPSSSSSTPSSSSSSKGKGSDKGKSKKEK